MRHLGLIIFLIVVLIVAALYPSKFTVVEYFENKKDASGNPVPKSTKTTTKTKSSGSPEPSKPAAKTPTKTPSKDPSKPAAKTPTKTPSEDPSKPAAKDPSKDKKDSKDNKHIGGDSTDSSDVPLEPSNPADSYQPFPGSGQSNDYSPNTLNKDKMEYNDFMKSANAQAKQIRQGIASLMKEEAKEEKVVMDDQWILKSTLIPCSCATTTCGHNLEQNSEDDDFALLNQDVEEGTDIGPYSRPLIADVQLPNSALNKDWVRNNLMQYQPPKPFLSDFQTFTY
jgi:hypothetical protein